MEIRFVRFCILFICSILVSTPTIATTFTPKDDVVGIVKHYRVVEDDTLYDFARRYDIGIVELLAANPGVDVWKPKAGTPLTLTTMHISTFCKKRNCA